MSGIAATHARRILDDRLLRIEEALGSDAKFAGLSAFYPDRWEASA